MPEIARQNVQFLQIISLNVTEPCVANIDLYLILKQVAKLMGQNVHHLLSDLIVLLRDDNLEVLLHDQTI